MPTAVRSHAKINLGLSIGAPRPDGFHSLATVYQTLELFDIVTVSAREAAQTRIRLTSNDGRVPTDGRNTAWKMVEKALETLEKSVEVEIHIEKRLPVQGGLGAGSANAIAALVGLEAELGWTPCPEPGSFFGGFYERGGVDPSNAQGDWPAHPYRKDCRTENLQLAAKIGSDVPLFLIGGAVLGRDHGQRVFPLPDFEPVWCVVATPDIGVSTPQAFRDWDALCVREGLTPEASDAKLEKLSRAYASAFEAAFSKGKPGAGSSGVLSSGENLAGPLESALVRTGITSWIQNDFEQVVFAQHPSLAEIKRVLAGTGTPEAALYASLSGSGSALFGLYLTRGAAESARHRLSVTGMASLLTRTLPRAAYWSEMVLQKQD